MGQINHNQVKYKTNKDFKEESLYEIFSYFRWKSFEREKEKKEIIK